MDDGKYPTFQAQPPAVADKQVKDQPGGREVAQQYTEKSHVLALYN
jgi:hypothetical protein